MRPIQLTFFGFCVCRTFLSFLTLCNTSPLFTRQSSWTSPSFCCTTFKTFKVFLIFYFEVSKFQHHSRLCSKCSIAIVSSINWSPILLPPNSASYAESQNFASAALQSEGWRMKALVWRCDLRKGEQSFVML